MTQFVDFTTHTSATGRRHTDPPALWAGVLTGSIVLHLLVFWIMASVIVRISFLQVPESSIPIDLLEVAPSSISSAEAAKSEPVIQRNTGEISASTEVPTPADSSQQELRQSIPATTTQSPPTTPARETSPIQPGTPTQAPPPPITSGTANQAGDDEESATDSSSVPTPQATSPTPNPTQPPLVPPFDPQPPPTEPSNEQQQPERRGIRATVVEIRNSPNDIPQEQAEPLGGREKSFDTILFPPIFGQNPSQTVVLEVALVINADGKVESARVLKAQPRQEGVDYDKLAQDTFASWQFKPARDGPENPPRSSDPTVVVRVEPF